MALYGTNLAAEEVETEEEESNVVIVTAQKRSERVTEVPIAISVFPQETIDQTGIQELREIGDYIPNMVVTQGTDFNSRILIRGVGAPSRNIGFDSRVGVYLDGVYLGQGPSVNQDLVDLERVEVLRGPQGTLFGKNTVAGAVSLVSAKPSGEFEGKGTVNVGNFNALEAKLSVDFALTDQVSAKIAASTRTRDGYIKNVYTEGQMPTTINLPIPGVGLVTGLDFINWPGSIPLTSLETAFPPNTSDEINNQDTQSYRVQLRIQPNDDLDINIALDGLQSERMPVLGVPLTTTFGDTPNHLADANNNEVNWSFQGREERDISGVNINIDYDMGNDFALRSITAFRDTEIIYQNDTDYSPLDFLYLYYQDNYDQTTQEFQLISPDDADFKYVVGVYYYDQSAETIRDAIGGHAAALFSVPYEGGAFNDGTVDTKSTALYLSGSYEFNERWKLGFGARYSRETKDVNWTLDGRASGSFSIGCTATTSCFDAFGDPIASVGSLNDSREDTNFSPALSLNFVPAENINLYYKFSTGFKSGGFNLDYVAQPDIINGLSFEPETVISNEIGLKTSLLDERLSLNMAYFVANYDDYQVNQFFDLGNAADGTPLTSIRIENAAEVDTSGFEIEANYIVTDNLTINGSLGFLDATFASYPDGANTLVATDDGQLARVPQDADGNKLPGAADINAALGIQYYANLDSIGWDLLARLDATYTGDYYTNVNNEKSRVVPGSHPFTAIIDLPHYRGPNPNLATSPTVPFGHVEATTMVSGRLGLISQEGDFEVYLWGRNLTDEDAAVDSFREFFGTLVETPRQPRTYGVEAVYNF